MTLVDPAFPQLDNALDTNLMRSVLQRHLFSEAADGTGYRIESCHIVEKRHKPGRRFALNYRLLLRSPQDGSSREQWVSARLASAANAPSKAMDEPGSPIYLSEVPMRLWIFPNDPGLPALGWLLDTVFLKSYLSRIVGTNQEQFVASVEPEVIHYLADKSCMIRYRIVSLPSRSGGAAVAREIFAKHYCDESGMETWRIMRQLTKQATCFARPLYYDADLRTLWQEGLPGKRAAWSDFAMPDYLKRIDRLAAVVATLHRSQVASERSYKLETFIRDLHKTVQIARRSAPAITGAVARRVTNLVEDTRSIDFTSTPVAPLHCDLKLCNCLIDGDAFALVDMDSLSLGDPLADVGSMLANFYFLGLRDGGEERAIEKRVDAFIRAYRRNASFPVENRRLYWYLAAALVHEVIRRGLRQHDRVRIELSERFLAISAYYSGLCREASAHA